MKKTVYYNGNIVTMDEENLYAEAVLVEEGHIKLVASKDEVFALTDDETELVDLNGHTLTPGFIDPHGHVGLNLTYADWADCRQVFSLFDFKMIPFEEVVESLKEWMRSHNIQPGQWVKGWRLVTPPTPIGKAELDPHFPDNPVCILHNSQHVISLNSMALKAIGITKDTPDPYGATFVRDTETGEPTGVLFGSTYFMRLLPELIQKPEDVDMAKMIEITQNNYFSNGITTAQEGLTTIPYYEALTEAEKNGALKMDVVAYMSEKDIDEVVERGELIVGDLNHKFSIGGLKLIMDGAAEEGYMTKPLKCTGRCGSLYIQPEDFEAHVRKAIARGHQIAFHIMGDASGDMVLDILEKIQNEGVYDVTKMRHIAIHFVYARKDQCERAAKLNMIVSFYSCAVSLTADRWSATEGIAAGSEICPVKWFTDCGGIQTHHLDSPVLIEDYIYSMWSAIYRRSQFTGKVFGAHHCLTAYEALKGITLNAAYQFKSEKIKGSLSAGKLADMVILNDNPLTCSESDFRNMRVLETIKDGVTVYKRA